MMLLRHLRRCSAGATAVEFALVGTIFFGVIVGTLQVGRVLLVRHNISNAVELAARAALLDPDATDAELAAIIANAIDFADRDQLVIASTEVGTSAGPMRQIRVQYPLEISLPFGNGTALTLSISRVLPGGR